MKKTVLLLCLCIAVFLCSCSPSTPIESDANETKLELNVWLDAATKEYMTMLLDVFSKQHPEVKIVVEDFSAMNIPDYRTKLAGALMSGSGPDIILSKNDANNILQNYTKLLQNDVFMSIEELGSDISNCNEKVMSVGRYNDKQYLVPLSYGLGFLLTTEERIDKYNINIESDLSRFADSLESIYDDNKYAFLDIITTLSLCPQNSLNCVDYTSGTLLLKGNSMKAMETISVSHKKLFPDLFVDNNMQDYRFSISKLKKYNNSTIEAFMSGDLVFYSAPEFKGAGENINVINTVCKDIVNSEQKPVLFTLPTYDKAQPAPIVSTFISVNNNTTNKFSAKLFVECAIGIDSQYLVSQGFGIPVNNKLIDIQENFFVNGEYNDESKKYLNQEHRYCSVEIAKTYFDTIRTMREGIYIDYNTCGKLYSVIRDIACNGLDINSAYESAANQIEIYLAE